MSAAHDLLFRMRIALTHKSFEARPVACISAWDANVQDPQTGHHRIDVALTLRWTEDGVRKSLKVWKRGETWCAVNRWTSVDGKEARELVLSLFGMKPGDTDSDYFAGWTKEQLAFASAWADTLSCEREARFCDENGDLR